MNILVIGGSYFYGRVFVMLAAKEHSVTVVNRGTYSMEEFGAEQVRGERHDPAVWQQCREPYDAIVDFCAYSAGDVECVLENLAGSVSQYILISTVDVYRRGTGLVLDETAPLEDRRFPGETGAYIAGKVALEREVREQCEKREIAWTVLRPAILYGPYNYAPRESLYIRMAVQEHALPEITDADGHFQLVYVKDGAEAIMRCLGNPVSYGQAYNICQDGSIDYKALFAGLKQAAKEEIVSVSVTAAAAAERGIPLPFPVYADESEDYSNEKGKKELGIAYIAAPEGLARTYRAFEGVYKN